MDIKTINDEITKLEREKAQLELRSEQISAERAKIEEALKARGLTVKDLDARIAELTAEITADLDKLGIKLPVAGAIVAAGPGVDADPFFDAV